MALNQYISQGITSEQDLYESLVIESIQIYGHDVQYLPRDIVNRDLILNEESESRFDDAYEIEVYIENMEAFEGQGNLMSKFGLEIRDEANLIVSKLRWNTAVGSPDGRIRPLEGDLIYFPLSKSFFEVSFVEHESPFYQLNNLNVYKMAVSLFEFSGEDFDTGVDAVDSIMAKDFNTILNINTIVGTFEVGETLTQTGTGYSVSGVITQVTGSALSITDITTSDNNFHLFTSGAVLGETSGATAVIANIDSMVDSGAQNSDFDLSADVVIDFSESNPFGEV